MTRGSEEIRVRVLSRPDIEEFSERSSGSPPRAAKSRHSFGGRGNENKFLDAIALKRRGLLPADGKKSDRDKKSGTVSVEPEDRKVSPLKKPITTEELRRRGFIEPNGNICYSANLTTFFKGSAHPSKQSTAPASKMDSTVLACPDEKWFKRISIIDRSKQRKPKQDKPSKASSSSSIASDGSHSFNRSKTKLGSTRASDASSAASTVKVCANEKWYAAGSFSNITAATQSERKKSKRNKKSKASKSSACSNYSNSDCAIPVLCAIFEDHERVERQCKFPTKSGGSLVRSDLSGGGLRYQIVEGGRCTTAQITDKACFIFSERDF